MKKRIISIIAIVAMLFSLSGRSMLESKINDIKGNLVGNGYDIYTYDNYGDKVLETSGDKISITGNKTETTSYDSDGSRITGMTYLQLLPLQLMEMKSRVAVIPVFLCRMVLMQK